MFFIWPSKYLQYLSLGDFPDAHVVSQIQMFFYSSASEPVQSDSVQYDMIQITCSHRLDLMVY